MVDCRKSYAGRMAATILKKECLHCLLECRSEAQRVISRYRLLSFISEKCRLYRASRQKSDQRGLYWYLGKMRIVIEFENF
jgi:hypothetical protein